ncbi:MAG: MEDS domain-containing protein [Thaumarchaeota archaeon]|nr:MEDS domain-containing protein [Nitrososphaerota archaeon]
MAQVNRERLEFIRHISPGQHVGVFWEDEDDKTSILVSVVKDRLRRGEFTFILTSDPKKVSSQLMAKGMMSQSHENYLRISDARQIFHSGGMFNPERVLDLAREVVDETVNRGYRCLTWIGDYAHLLYDQRIQSLVELEEGVGKKAPYDRMTAFCFLYTKGIGCGELIRIIKSHGHGIFPGITMTMT